MEAALFVLSTGFGVFGLYLAFHWTKWNLTHMVGRLSDLRCSPLASCAGMRSHEANFTEDGIEVMGVLDKTFMLAKLTNPEFARTHPADTMRQYFCPDMRQLQAFSDGKLIMFSNPQGLFLKCKLQDVKKSYNQERTQVSSGQNIILAVPAAREHEARIAAQLRDLGLFLFLPISNMLVNEQGRSAHGNYTVWTDETANYIDKTMKLTTPISAYFFRPNVVIQGCLPLEETSWQEIRIGEEVVMKTYGPDTRVIETKPQYNLREFRPTRKQKVNRMSTVLVFDSLCHTFIAGVNARVIKGGPVHRGDRVCVVYQHKLQRIFKDISQFFNLDDSVDPLIALTQNK